MVQRLSTLIGSQLQHISISIDDHSQVPIDTQAKIWGLTPQPQLKSCTNIPTLEYL